MSDDVLVPLWQAFYSKEREELLSEGVCKLLEEGRRWDLAPVIARGGGILFPHASLASCGALVAAAVHACLDSGADQILSLGVLHGAEHALVVLRRSHLAGANYDNHPRRGVYGPDLMGARHYTEEFSLDGFEFLLEQECGRRGCKVPKLIKRYPFLVGRDPDSLPGLDELKALKRRCVLVATADLIHQGKAYFSAEAPPICEASRQLAQRQITHCLKLLGEGDYDAFRKESDRLVSDGLDVCAALRALLGPFRPDLRDVRLVDTSHFHQGKPRTCWVAASLTACSPLRSNGTA